MRRFRIRLIRLLMAAAALAGAASALNVSHDFQLTRHRFEKMRQGDPETLRRPWLTRFFFINEAGSGLRYMLTGNPRHLDHYPSPRHILADRMTRARETGDWKQHMRIAETLWLQGDPASALRWADVAADLAPEEHHALIAQYLVRLRQAVEEEGGGELPEGPEEEEPPGDES